MKFSYFFCCVLLTTCSVTNPVRSIELTQRAKNTLVFENHEKDIRISFNYETEDGLFYLERIFILNGGRETTLSKNAFKTGREGELFFVEKIAANDLKFDLLREGGFNLEIAGGDGAGTFLLRFVIEEGVLKERVIVSRDRQLPLSTNYQREGSARP